MTTSVCLFRVFLGGRISCLTFGVSYPPPPPLWFGKILDVNESNHYFLIFEINPEKTTKMFPPYSDSAFFDVVDDCFGVDWA